ncbi:hypothetical protein PsorP6_014992 [Peronosclerospora sorghi]|uniref:Uncharacterized protein n=1 Tax=Peronosclerospora sorghi TaxID=230839 RepID=A0ACC0VSI4_9STRA|nr:hypothetical protein PsorP6_014992 [Peronosclerospora sorghi]
MEANLYVVMMRFGYYPSTLYGIYYHSVSTESRLGTLCIPEVARESACLHLQGQFFSLCSSFLSSLVQHHETRENGRTQEKKTAYDERSAT